MILGQISLFSKDSLIISLAFCLLTCLWIIRKLTVSLKREQRNKPVPVLALNTDVDEKMGFSLDNIGEYIAFNIIFDPAEVTLSSGFDKTFILRFDTRDELQPKSSAKLNFKLFDGEKLLPPETTRQLFLQLAYANFDLNIRFKNHFQAPFLITMRKTKLTSQIVSFHPIE